MLSHRRCGSAWSGDVVRQRARHVLNPPFPSRKGTGQPYLRIPFRGFFCKKAGAGQPVVRRRVVHHLIQAATRPGRYLFDESRHEKIRPRVFRIRWHAVRLIRVREQKRKINRHIDRISRGIPGFRQEFAGRRQTGQKPTFIGIWSRGLTEGAAEHFYKSFSF